MSGRSHTSTAFERDPMAKRSERTVLFLCTRFFGVTLSWQFMFLVIGSDPIRFRRAMIPSMLEKASFAVAIPILYALERVTVTWVGFASMDATWLVLFVIAYMRTPKEAAP